MTPPSPALSVRGHRRPILALAFLSLFLSGTQSTQAADGKTDKTTKPAWQWTLEERLAKRFDSKAIRARVAAKVDEMAAFQKNLEAQGSSPLGNAEDFASWTHRSDIDVITGHKNPELFLPLELFSYLLLDAFPPEGVDANEYRRMIEERAVALGFGSDLWIRLRKAAAPVLALERQREKLAKGNPSASTEREGAEMNESDIAFCRARAKAMAKAEAEFGKEPFLRLLYEATITSSEVVYHLYEGIAEHQRYLEEGCK